MMLPRMHDSPIPMYTTSGLDSETATAPTDALFTWPSVTGVHVIPPSVVFQSPPPTAPKYASFGRPFTPLTAIDRPPRSGPILRHLYDLRIAESSGADVVSIRTRVESMARGAAVVANASAVAPTASRAGDRSIRVPPLVAGMVARTTNGG